ncbi:MAG: hypothetical protein RSE41_00335 [Clostridia bacterium]
MRTNIKETAVYQDIVKIVKTHDPLQIGNNTNYIQFKENNPIGLFYSHDNMLENRKILAVNVTNNELSILTENATYHENLTHIETYFILLEYLRK